MITAAIDKLVMGESLNDAEAGESMEEIMSGTATPAQIGAFLVALRMKGETIEEIAGLAQVMRSRAIPVELGDATGSPLGRVVDTCGTGGDRAGTFNISTVSALVAAAAGVPVAKHGNRAASSHCGSADLLEALGVRIDLDPDGVARCVDEAGIGFMFAPVFHPSFKYAAVPRRELGIRTVFNILGPLCNPAHAAYQAMGVAEEGLADKMAGVLSRLGVRRALVFHAADGMDELSVTGPSRVIEIADGSRSDYVLEPEELGLAKAPLEAMRG